MQQYKQTNSPSKWQQNQNEIRDSQKQENVRNQMAEVNTQVKAEAESNEQVNVQAQLTSANRLKSYEPAKAKI